MDAEKAKEAVLAWAAHGNTYSTERLAFIKPFLFCCSYEELHQIKNISSRASKQNRLMEWVGPVQEKKGQKVNQPVEDPVEPGKEKGDQTVNMSPEEGSAKQQKGHGEVNASLEDRSSLQESVAGTFASPVNADLASGPSTSLTRPLGRDKPRFGYWDIRGFGQPIRFLLEYLQVDYEEVTYKCRLETKFKDWDAAKVSLGLDFPNLPYWIDHKVKLTESRAIIAHLAREYDPSLLPARSRDLVNAQMLDGVMSEIWTLLVNVTYFNSRETVEDYNRNVPTKLSQISSFIAKLGGPWVMGQKISYLDFLLYEILLQNMVFNSSLLQDLPNLRDLMTRFEWLPAISAFMASETYIKGPCFRPWARFQI